jgi:ABC-type uncharacterized transport system substrate-binding protein
MPQPKPQSEATNFWFTTLAPGQEVALKAARDATRTIPIVMVAIDYDPVALGYVQNLARPGGNITGVYPDTIDFVAKRAELLK